MRFLFLMSIFSLIVLFGCIDSNDDIGHTNTISGKSLGSSIVFDTICPMVKGDTISFPIELEKDEPYVFYIRPDYSTFYITVKLKDSSGTEVSNNLFDMRRFLGLTTPYAGRYLVEAYIDYENVESEILTLQVEKSEKLTSEFDGCWYLHDRSFNVPNGETFTFTMPISGVCGFIDARTPRFEIQGDSIYFDSLSEGLFKYLSYHLLDKDVLYRFDKDTLFFQKKVNSINSSTIMTTKYLRSECSLDELVEKQSEYNYEAPDSFLGPWYLARKIEWKYDYKTKILDIENAVTDSISELSTLLDIRKSAYDVYLKTSITGSGYEKTSRSIDDCDRIFPWGYRDGDYLVMGNGCLDSDFDAYVYIYKKYNGELPPEGWTE